jgi:hypothetical protein
MAGKGRVIVGCQHGRRESRQRRGRVPDRWRRARPAQGRRDVAHVGRRATRAARLRRWHPHRQDPPGDRLHAQFIEKGGRFYVCPICFKERSLDESELVENAELKGGDAADGVRRLRCDDVHY